MAEALRKVVSGRDLGAAFERMAKIALEGDVGIRLAGGEEVVLVAKSRYDNLRPTPQQFVSENSVSTEASDLLDQMIAQHRSDGPAPHGV